MSGLLYIYLELSRICCNLIARYLHERFSMSALGADLMMQMLRHVKSQWSKGLKGMRPGHQR